jgi:hypothetical protein
VTRAIAGGAHREHDRGYGGETGYCQMLDWAVSQVLGMEALYQLGCLRIEVE